jgi:hypothetical protein
MHTNPREKYFPAMHKFGKNAHKKLETIRSMMQKLPHYLDQYSFSYEFLKWKKNKKTCENQVHEWMKKMK